MGATFQDGKPEHALNVLLTFNLFQLENMTAIMRAKFRCESNDGDENSKTAKLTTEYSDTPEDNMFNEATPWGNIELGIDKKGAMNFLKPGKSYYVDFTEVPE